MSFFKNKYLLIATALVSLVIVAVYSLSLYKASLVEDMGNGACDTLNELTDQQAFNLNVRLQSDINSIKNAAKAISYINNGDVDLPALLREFVNDTNFEHIVLVDSNGRGTSSNGAIVDVGNRDYFASAMQGETVLSIPVVSKIDNENIIAPIITPVYTDNKILNVLIGAYDINNLSKMLLPSYGGEGFAYVTDSKGEVIISPSSNNAFDKHNNVLMGFGEADVIKYDNKLAVQDNMMSGRPGHSVISLGNQRLFVHYTKLSINDWYIFMMVPEKSIISQSSGIIARSTVLIYVVIAIMCFFVAVILWLQRRSGKARAEYTSSLEKIAFYDEITGLPNLYRFKMLANRKLSENHAAQGALLKFDINNFKLINETYGYSTGNLVLQTVARAIEKVRDTQEIDDVIYARINADEFVVFDISDITIDNVGNRFDSFLAEFEQMVSQIIKGWHIEFSYGRYFLELGEYDIYDALEKVNLAHRTAKNQKNGYSCDYNESLKQQYVRRVEIEQKMEAAMANGEFRVYLQPKYELAGEKIVGAEALVRWVHPDGEVIAPAHFIPIFEVNGFVTKLDMYVFEQVCVLLRSWVDDGKPAVPVSVNFSRMHLANEDFVRQLVAIANRYSVARRFLEVELTESVFLENEEVLQSLLISLHDAGFRLSMDDFGTGYSSLGLLKNLPVDIIKIDRSFFTDNKDKSRAKSVVESVLQLAKKLSIFTVAEGVESRENVDFLREVGCDVVQGFYYAKPRPAELFFDTDSDFAPPE